MEPRATQPRKKLQLLSILIFIITTIILVITLSLKDDDLTSKPARQTLRALASGKQAIDHELQRAKFLLASGGFFPSCDHHIPPDVPLENMVYFVNALRKLSDYPETRRVVTL